MDTAAARLLTLIDRFAEKRVLVVGDLIADEFIYGRVARVSREAPVLILEYDATEILPGGAGNAARNVAALGGDALAAGIAGRDEPAARMLQVLGESVDVRGVLRPRAWRTPTKTRILAGGVHSAKQQVVRIDRAAGGRHDRATRDALAARVLRIARRADAVLFSDYGSGLVTPALANAVRRALAERGRDVPVLVDSRYALLRYRGLTAYTPNESEVESLLGVTIDDDRRVLERAGRDLLGRLKSRAVLVTRGGRGMALFEPDKPTEHIAIYGTDEVADVTGAGDTVIATMTLALAAGATFSDAAHLANFAGGIVVMKRGTATVGADELRGAIRGGHDR